MTFAPYVIEIYAAIMKGKKSSSAISLHLKPGVKYIKIKINHTVKSLKLEVVSLIFQNSFKKYSGKNCLFIFFCLIDNINI